MQSTTLEFFSAMDVNNSFWETFLRVKTSALLVNAPFVVSALIPTKSTLYIITKETMSATHVSPKDVNELH